MNHIAPATDGFPIPPDLTQDQERIRNALLSINCFLEAIEISSARDEMELEKRWLWEIHDCLLGKETFVSVCEKAAKEMNEEAARIEKKNEEFDRYWNATWYRRLIRRFFPAR